MRIVGEAAVAACFSAWSATQTFAVCAAGIKPVAFSINRWASLASSIGTNSQR